MRFIETLVILKVQAQARNPPKLMHLCFLCHQAGGIQSLNGFFRLCCRAQNRQNPTVARFPLFSGLTSLAIVAKDVEIEAYATPKPLDPIFFYPVSDDMNISDLMKKDS